MKIVIDIPEAAYKLLNNKGVDWLGAEHILGAVANGKPLSKGYGDLIDRKELLKAMDTWPKFGCTADGRLVPCDDNLVPYVHYADMVQAVKGMPTIIGADQENENEIDD